MPPKGGKLDCPCLVGYEDREPVHRASAYYGRILDIVMAVTAKGLKPVEQIPYSQSGAKALHRDQEHAMQ